MRRRWLGVLVLCACEDGGFARLAADLVVPAGALELGAVYVGASRSGAIALENRGDGPIELVFSAPAPFAVVGALRRRLPGGARLELAVELRPTAAGVFAAELAIDAEGHLFAIALHGQGLAPLECDDGNACTDEGFDPAAGACLRAPREGGCDDANRCTSDDRCSNGRCVGEAVACPDAPPCGHGVCDPEQGCVLFFDHDACADDDPCTVDRCTEGGCVHDDAPIGTSCGAVDGCRTAEVCILGACRKIDVFDGFPCEDGDACTEGDECRDGACVPGPPSPRDLELVGALPSFGVGRLWDDGGAHALTADGRVVFLDQLGDRLWATRAHLAGARLVPAPAGELTLPGARLSGAALALASRGAEDELVVCLTRGSTLSLARLRIGGPAIALVAEIPLGPASDRPCALAHGPPTAHGPYGLVFADAARVDPTHGAGSFTVYAIDLGLEVVTSSVTIRPATSSRRGVGAYAVDPTGPRLFVAEAAGVRAYSLSVAGALTRGELVAAARDPYALVTDGRWLGFAPAPENDIDSPGPYSIVALDGRDPPRSVHLDYHSVVSSAVLAGGRLFLGHAGHGGWDGQVSPTGLAVYDLSADAAPVASRARPWGEVVSGLEVVGRTVALMSGPRAGPLRRALVFELDDTAGRLELRAAPGMGPLGRIVELDGRLLALSRSGVHRLDPSGRGFDRGVVHDEQVGLYVFPGTASTATVVHFVAPGWARDADEGVPEYTPLARVAVDRELSRRLHAPAPGWVYLDTAHGGRAGGVRWLERQGGPAYALSAAETADDALGDLSALPRAPVPDLADGVQRANELHPRGFLDLIDLTSARLPSGAERWAMVRPDVIETSSTSQLATRILVVDEGPTRRTMSARLPGAWSSVALAGELLLGLDTAGPVLELVVVRLATRELLPDEPLFRPPEDPVDPIARLPVEGAFRIVATSEGHDRVLFAAEGGVLEAELGAAPRVIGRGRLPRPPVDGRFVGGHWLVGNPRELELLRPACKTW